MNINPIKIKFIYVETTKTILAHIKANLETLYGINNKLRHYASKNNKCIMFSNNNATFELRTDYPENDIKDIANILNGKYKF